MSLNFVSMSEARIPVIAKSSPGNMSNVMGNNVGAKSPFKTKQVESLMEYGYAAKGAHVDSSLTRSKVNRQ